MRVSVHFLGPSAARRRSVGSAAVRSGGRLRLVGHRGRVSFLSDDRSVLRLCTRFCFVDCAGAARNGLYGNSGVGASSGGCTMLMARCAMGVSGIGGLELDLCDVLFFLCLLALDVGGGGGGDDVPLDGDEDGERLFCTCETLRLFGFFFERSFFFDDLLDILSV